MDIFEDTSYDMELEKIKSKVKTLYESLLTNTYKKANPMCTQEDIFSFLEDNTVEFKGKGFDESAEELESILDEFMELDEEDTSKEVFQSKQTALLELVKRRKQNTGFGLW